MFLYCHNSLLLLLFLPCYFLAETLIIEIAICCLLQNFLLMHTSMHHVASIVPIAVWLNPMIYRRVMGSKPLFLKSPLLGLGVAQHTHVASAGKSPCINWRHLIVRDTCAELSEMCPIKGLGKESSNHANCWTVVPILVLFGG